VAYLVGFKPFFGLDITVTPAVLIPRPETELLVERVLAYARFLVGLGQTPRIADVGTGSGAIAVVLAVNLPQAIIYATDVSEQALAVAGQNVWRYGVGEQVQLLPGHLLEPLPEPVDIVVANLPYVATADLANLPRQPAPAMPVGPGVRDYEPILALDGGPDGLDTIRALFDSLIPGGAAHGKLSPGGRIYLEIGAGQGPRVLALAQQMMAGAQAELETDYADLDRLVIVTI
jgi:release factor glutamine methyltransferase